MSASPCSATPSQTTLLDLCPTEQLHSENGREEVWECFSGYFIPLQSTPFGKRPPKTNQGMPRVQGHLLKIHHHTYIACSDLTVQFQVKSFLMQMCAVLIKVFCHILSLIPPLHGAMAWVAIGEHMGSVPADHRGICCQSYLGHSLVVFLPTWHRCTWLIVGSSDQQ